MLRWKQLGPKWPTMEVFRVLELLRERHIPYRMPLDDMFSYNIFRPCHPGLRWEILVRRRDWDRAIALLVGDGLLNRSTLDLDAPKP